MTDMVACALARDQQTTRDRDRGHRMRLPSTWAPWRTDIDGAAGDFVG
jgi:hypothetical protein